MSHVLISGAGPVGLWLAGELRLRDVDVTVVETRNERSPHSKALTIHPRTLELFAQRGIVDELLERGVRIPAGHFGALEQKLDFRPLDTDFPFTLLFPQSETERILERRARDLGADVRRGHTLVGFDEDADAVRARVRLPGGGEEVVVAAFLAGCDGAGSTVRRLAGIDFPGDDADTFGILADVELAAPPATPLHGFSDVTGQLMIVPLPGGGHRIVGVDPTRQSGPAGAIDADELRESVVRICGQDFGMGAPAWVSRYGNASRVAGRYARGRVVLAGDAAHMHFPAGGVGMNVGIQDAHGLGWRLADVLGGLAPLSALDAYHDERHPVGLGLVLGTQAQTALLAAFDADRQALRVLMGGLIARIPELSLALAERLAGLDVAYGSPDATHPLVGRRLRQTATTARSVHPMLLCAASSLETLAQVVAPAGVRTAAAPAAETLLVRPDGHVAWAAAHADASAVADAVRSLRPLAPAPAHP